jgi:hypothetical protein
MAPALLRRGCPNRDAIDGTLKESAHRLALKHGLADGEHAFSSGRGRF